MEERIILKNLSKRDLEFVPWRAPIHPVDVHAASGLNGALNIVSQAGRYSPKPVANPLLFARTEDGGATWCVKQHLPSVGGSPQSVETQQGLFIGGTRGFCRSDDNGKTFSPHTLMPFGDRFIFTSTDQSRSMIYVVGDSVREGLFLHSSHDCGRTWMKTKITSSKTAHAWRYPAVSVDSRQSVHVVWMDDNTGHGVMYHSSSNNQGKSFSKAERISDEDFPMPVDAPYPPPANQDGTWVGNRLGLTACGDRVIVAWSDQRSGRPNSKVYVSIGTLNKTK
jgi:hypothetical protein